MPTWKLDDATRTTSAMQYSAGGAYNQANGCWQLWVSLDGYHINWVAAYRERGRIDAAMQEMKQRAEAGDLFHLETLAAILDRFYAGSDTEPRAMPEAVEVIRRSVRGTGKWRAE